DELFQAAMDLWLASGVLVMERAPKAASGFGGNLQHLRRAPHVVAGKSNGAEPLRLALRTAGRIREELDQAPRAGGTSGQGWQGTHEAAHDLVARRPGARAKAMRL